MHVHTSSLPSHDIIKWTGAHTCIRIALLGPELEGKSVYLFSLLSAMPLLLGKIKGTKSSLNVSSSLISHKELSWNT